jgi:hypothetical protein
MKTDEYLFAEAPIKHQILVDEIYVKRHKRMTKLVTFVRYIAVIILRAELADATVG